MSYPIGSYGSQSHSGDHRCPFDRNSGQKAVVKNADMSEEMQREAVGIAIEALQLHSVEKDIAALIKKRFDDKFGPTWHCIVGRNYGR